MKPRCFLFALLIFVLFSGTGAAEIVCRNNITLEKEGMSWSYTEKYAALDSVLFKEVTDRGSGNGDGFVNAWELLKMELGLEGKLRSSIEKKCDVKLNNSSEDINILDVEFWLSDAALGKVSGNSVLENRFQVTYSFGNFSVVPGTRVCFSGTPESEVNITLPEGINVSETYGLENKSIGLENGRVVLKGRFGFEGNLTLQLSESSKEKSVQAINASEEVNASGAVNASEERDLRLDTKRKEQKLFNLSGIFQNLFVKKVQAS